MKKNNTLNLVSNFVAKFSVRTAQKDGRPHLVAPVVALREGVHCGMIEDGETSCLFYPSSEISDTAQNWNGVPLTAFHPEINGQLVAVEQALKPFKIGTFENVTFEAGELNGEVWIDIALAQAISPATLQMVRTRTNMEVSTGLGLLRDQKKGTWNGESFDESVFDFKPDHLALLPGGQGACSIADGCGVIMNTKKECGTCKFNLKGGEKNVNERTLAFENHLSKEGDTSAERWPLLIINDVVTQLKREGFSVNEIGHSKVREKLNKIVNDMDKPGVQHFVREPFNTHFIFERFVQAENESTLFRQDFSINKHDEIRIKGDPIEVEEQRLFPIKTNNKKEEIMSNDVAQVKAVTSKEYLPFTEEDTTWLETLEPNAFSRIVNYECQCPDAKKYNSLVEEHNTTVGKYEILTKEKTALEEKLTLNESKSKEKENHVTTFEELLSKAKPGMREAIEDGIVTNEAKRAKLIEALVGNNRCGFTKEALEDKKIQELEKLVTLGSVPVDYSLKGNGGQTVYGPNEKKPDGTGVPLVQSYVEWK